MSFRYVTTINPLGISVWVEDTISGPPTDNTPEQGSIAIVATAGERNYYQKTGASTWSLMLRAPLDLAAVIQDAAQGVIGGGLWLPVTLPAGAGTTAVVLPVRTGGWRVVDAYLTSGGVGGTVTVRNPGVPADITDAMAPGAADAITRAAVLDITFAEIASGGTLEFVRVGAFLAARIWVRIEPL